MTEEETERVLESLKLVDYLIQKKLNIKPIDKNYEDYRQEGYIGLIYASIRFKPEKGYKFSTYASSYIINRVRTYRMLFVNRYIHTSRKAIEIMPKVCRLLIEGYTSDEVLNTLRITEDEYNEIMSNLTISSVNKPLAIDSDGSEVTIADTLGKEDIGLVDLLSEERIEYCIQKVADLIKDKNKRGVWYDYIYSAYFGEKLNENYLSKKYSLSQPYISRLLRKYKNKFRDELLR